MNVRIFVLSCLLGALAACTPPTTSSGANISYKASLPVVGELIIE